MLTTPRRSTLKRIRWGGMAAVLAGLSYAAAGYLDRPGASARTVILVAVLGAITPALFLGGLLALRSRLLLGARRSLPVEAGFLLGCLGAALGLADALGLERALPALSGLATNWGWGLALLCAGLALMGLATRLARKRRRSSSPSSSSLGALVLASGALGLVSVLTDPDFSGVVVPAQPVHAAFAAAFCASAIAWGGVLLLRPRGRPRF